MVKKKTLIAVNILLLFLLFAVHLFPVDEIVLKESESTDFLGEMDKNEMFVKRIRAVDVAKNAGNNYDFYFLDHKLGTVFRVDGNTGKLINTISSLGQGPAELDTPVAIRVRNQMVFIADFGFGGVKVFKTDGTIVNEFRTGQSIGWLDVNKKNEIFVRETDTGGTPVISSYNIDGKRLRNVLRFPVGGKGDKIAHILTREFKFSLDSKENLIVLFLFKKIIGKYNQKGTLLWEKKVDNEIIRTRSKPKKPAYGKGGSVHLRRSVFHLDIDEKDNITVGHIFGGMVLDKDGKMTRLIRTEPQMHMDLFKFYDNDNKLLRVLSQGWKINIYNYK